MGKNNQTVAGTSTHRRLRNAEQGRVGGLCVVERFETKMTDFGSADAWTVAASHAIAGGVSAVMLVAVHLHTDSCVTLANPCCGSLVTFNIEESSTLFGGIHESRLRQRVM